MANFKMNLFEHYRQKDSLPIENNISRILARILNDNIYFFNNFLDIINGKAESISLEKPQESYNVDFQKKVEDINTEYYDYIIGVALTAKELYVDEDKKENEINRNLIPDIVIENYNKVLIIIEVKRTDEDCRAQLENQIVSIKNGENIKSEIVSITWKDIIKILQQYLKCSKQKDIVIEDYYNYLKYHYKQWFPIQAFPSYNDKIMVDKRIDILMQDIEVVSKQKFIAESNKLKISGWKWTNQIYFENKNDNSISIKIWACDSGKQFKELIQKTKNLSFISNFSSESIIEINNITKIKTINQIISSLKISNAYGGYIIGGELNKEKYKNKEDYINIFEKLNGKWEKNKKIDNFVKNDMKLTEEINKLCLDNKEEILNKIVFILNNTERQQINISLSICIEYNISLLELSKADQNFSIEDNIDELAKPIHEFICNCKEEIESDKS